MTYVGVENLVKKYGTEEAAVMAVRGISFEAHAGDWIAFMGESGSGKSTLLSMLGALNTPTSGKYRVDGVDVYSLEQEERADFRRTYLGFVFQSFHLVPYLTVRENVMLPLAPVKIRGKEKKAKADEALARVGLEGKGNRLPNQISGGEQERVAVARAIVNRPSILLADEPTGNLDTKTTRGIMELLKRLNSEGMTILMVTHNPECAQYARRVLHLSDGMVLEQEETEGKEGGNGSGLGERKGEVAATDRSPLQLFQNALQGRELKGVGHENPFPKASGERRKSEEIRPGEYPPGEP